MAEGEMLSLVFIMFPLKVFIITFILKKSLSSRNQITLNKMETCFGKMSWRIQGKSGHYILMGTVLIFGCRSPTQSVKYELNP
jgi:hypothetical protein